MRILLVLLCLGCCLTIQEKDKEIEKLVELDVKKPLQDKRSFFHSKLKNGLEVVLIQDPSLTEAQISLGVDVGSLMDPLETQGLAHFLEHMLFMGSAKYPSTNAFSDCIAKYQGRGNAYTSQRRTVYFYSLVQTGLSECLDIFAQFFIEPSLEEQAVGKEVNAVNSEFQNYRGSQPWTQFYASQLLVNKQHPLSKFNVGNLDSLLYEPKANNVSLIANLRQFHDQYYSSNIMKLVIISKGCPYQLFEQVQPLFSQIKDLGLDSSTFYDQSIPLYNHDGQLMVKFQAKNQAKTLNILFEVPLQEHNYNQQSLNYVMELLQVTHNGPNSLSRYLKEQQYIYHFDHGVHFTFQTKSTLIFEFDLTPKGYKHIKKVLSGFYKHVESIDPEQLDINGFECLRQKNEAQFLFSQKVSAPHTLVENLFNYRPEDLLFGSYSCAGGLDKEAVKQILNSLSRDKAQYMLANDHFVLDKEQVEDKIKSTALDQQHHYTQVTFQILKDKIHLKNINRKQKKVKIMDNKYIPSSVDSVQPDDQTILCDSNKLISKEPLKILNNEHLQVWHLKDN